jgi:hypothetical protein
LDLDDNRLLPEHTGYIQFGMIMDGYPEVFLDLKYQKRADAFEFIRSISYQLFCTVMQ